MTRSRWPPRAVVFDLDGTLTDSAPGICGTLETVLVESGLPAPDHLEARTMIGLPLRSIFQRYAPTADDPALDRFVDRYRRIYADTVIPQTRLFPGIWSLLRACGTPNGSSAAPFTLALVTAKSTPVAIKVLDHCRIRRLFRSVVGGDLAPRPKPHPDLLLLALEELGVSPSEALVIGDGDHDVAMGRSAGALTCAVTWGVHPPDRLRAAHPDWLVHSTHELHQLLVGR